MFPRSKFVVVLGGGIRMVTLPRYMLSSQGSVAERFENAAQWEPSAGSAANNNTPGEFTEGNQSVKFTTAAAAQRSYKAGFSLDVSEIERLYWDVYFHDTYKSVWLRLYGNHNYTPYFDISPNTVGYTNFIGMHKQRLSKRLFGNLTGGMTYATPVTDLRITIETTDITSVSVDNLVLDAKGFGAGVILCFDDGYTSHYSTVFPMLRAHRIRASLALISTYADATISWEQLQELDAAGWTIANHGNAETELAGKNLAEQTTIIQDCITALEAHGLTRGNHYLIAPGGSYDATTYTAMTNLGMLLNRGVSTQDFVNLLPHEDLHQIRSNTINSSDTVASAEVYLDNAITDKGIAIYHFHNIGGVGEWTEAQLQEFVDYIVTKCKAGLLYPLTFDDFYRLHLGPVSIPAVV